MKCIYCNSNMNDNARFCTNCGKSVLQQASSPKENLNTQPNIRMNSYDSPKKSNGLLIAFICVFAFLVLVGVIGIVVLLLNIGGGREDNVHKESTATVQIEEPAASPKNEPEPEPKPVPFDRFETYSSNFYYQNMSDIHSSVPVSDEECFEMKEFVEKYNSLWISYINNNDYSIFTYLRNNTTAYSNTIGYKKANMTEQFELIDVNDVRKTNNYYYVWVHEKIVEYYPNQTKNMEYHWVYRIGKDSNGYYVEDYRTDPYYN